MAISRFYSDPTDPVNPVYWIPAFGTGFRFEDDVAGPGVTIKYEFKETGTSPEGDAARVMSETEKDLIRDAVHKIELQANVTFVESVAASAEILFGWGASRAPAGSASGTTYFRNNLPVEVWAYQDTVAGNTYIYKHETLHALGLAHSTTFFGNTTNPIPDDQGVGTTLFGNWSANGAYQNNYQLFDIAALQYRYGPPPGQRAGNDVYTLNPGVFDPTSAQAGWPLLWDGGGFDTLNYSAFALSVNISLVPGELSRIGSATGNILSAGVFSINYRTVIEAVSGGSGNDRLTGNSVANTINGGGGADVLDGGLGNDTITGGPGDDRYIYAPAGGGDTMVGFVAGPGSDDKLNLKAFANLHTLNDVLAISSQNGADTVINFGAGNTVTLQGVSKASLHADDFLLDYFQDPFVAFSGFGASAAGGNWTSADKYPRELADVNGDSRSDIVAFGEAGVYVALANANGTFAAAALALSGFGAGPGGGNWTSANKYPRELGDVNGDGRADIVAFGETGVYVALGNANGSFQPAALAISGFGAGTGGGSWTSADKYPRHVADVNGDGRADIVAFGEVGVYVALGNANATFQPATLALSGFGAGPGGGNWTGADKYPRELADVSGDGRADIVAFGETGVYVSLGTINGSFLAPALVLSGFGTGPGGGSWTSADKYPRRVADVNDDGRADIVAFGDIGVYVAAGNGDGSFQQPVLDLSTFGVAASAGSWTSADKYPRQVADVNGDGSADIVAFGNSGALVALAKDFDFI